MKTNNINDCSNCLKKFKINKGWNSEYCSKKCRDEMFKEWNIMFCVYCDSEINTEKDLYVTGESLGEYWCENCINTGSNEK